MNGQSKQRWLLAAAFAVIAVVVGLGLAGILEEGAQTTSSLALLMLGGVVALILVLGGLASAYAAMNLSNHSHALALPQGSIRAVLALSLVVIFVGVSAFLFLGLSAPRDTMQIRELSKVTEDQLKGIPGEFIVLKVPRKTAGEDEKDEKGAQLFDATIFIRGFTEASADLAKQIFTTIATVLVTVIGFYFGSRSAAAATGVGPGGGADVDQPKDPTGSARAAGRAAKGAAAAATEAAERAVDAAKEARSQANAIDEAAQPASKKAAEAEAQKAEKAMDEAEARAQEARNQASKAAKHAQAAEAAGDDVAKAQAAAKDADEARKSADQAANAAEAKAKEAEEAKMKARGA